MKKQSKPKGGLMGRKDNTNRGNQDEEVVGLNEANMEDITSDEDRRDLQDMRSGLDQDETM
jgi:hypothetical protein